MYKEIWADSWIYQLGPMLLNFFHSNRTER
jgi:hypothetical protein